MIIKKKQCIFDLSITNYLLICKQLTSYTSHWTTKELPSNPHLKGALENTLSVHFAQENTDIEHLNDFLRLHSHLIS